MLISPAYAQAAGGGGDLIGAFLPLILIFVIFYFLLIRPQQKKQKEHKAKVSAVKRGDRVVLGGGIYGTVTQVISDLDCTIEISKGVEINVMKQTILDVINKEDAPPTPAPAKTKAAAKTPAKRKTASRKKTQAADKKDEPSSESE